MSQNEVVIKLTVDGASKAAQDIEGVGESASKSSSKLSGLITGGLKGAGAAVAGFAAAAVAAGGTLAVGIAKNYAAYEQNLGGIETMFGSASDKMVGYASEAYKTAGLSANAYMEQVTSFSAALLQGLGGNVNLAADIANQAMVDMSDNANKFGTDIESIQNAYQGFAKQNYTMLDNLKLGYGGTASEMARLINDSGVMGDTMEVTAQTVNDISFDKIIEAIHVMQERMDIAGTTAQEATETISGSIGMLQASWTNLLTGLGSADTSAIPDLMNDVLFSVEAVADNLGALVTNIGDNMAAIGPQLGDVMTSLIDIIVAALPAVLSAGTSIVEGLATGIANGLPQVISALVPILVQLVETIAMILPELITAGGEAIAALATGLAEAAPTLIPVLAEAIVGMLESLVDVLPLLLEAGLLLIQGLADGLLLAMPVLIESLPLLITGIVEFLVQSIPILIQASIQLFMAIVQAIPLILGALVAALPQIIQTIIRGVIQAIPQLLAGAVQLFMAIVHAVPMILGSLLGAMGALLGQLISFIGGHVGRMVTAGFQLFTGLIGNIGGAISKIVSVVPRIISGLVSAVGRGTSQMVTAGYNLITGLWDGISAAGSWLYNQMTSWASGLVSKVKGAFGIGSPSKVFRDEIGQWLPKGLGKGIIEYSFTAVEPLDDLERDIVRRAKVIPKLVEDISFSVANTSSPYPVVNTTPVPYASMLPTDKGESVRYITTTTAKQQPEPYLPDTVALVDTDGGLIARLKTEVVTHLGADADSRNLMGV